MSKIKSFIKNHIYKPKNGAVQLIMVGGVGGVGFLIDLALMFFLIRVILIEPILSNFISTGIVIVLNWLGNRTFVFNKTGSVPKELIQFVVASLAGLIFSTAAIWFIVYQLDDSSNFGIVLAKFLGLFAGIVIKFVLYKYWVFKK
jgi:putative flippase GtrA